jgi:hypothetical protein
VTDRVLLSDRRSLRGRNGEVYAQPPHRSADRPGRARICAAAALTSARVAPSPCARTVGDAATCANDRQLPHRLD